MAKARKGYRRCSAQGCRKKAVLGGRCRAHVREKSGGRLPTQKGPAPSAIEIPGAPLREIAERIRRVEKSSKDSTGKGPGKRSFRSRRGLASGLCFELGAITGKLSVLFREWEKQ